MLIMDHCRPIALSVTLVVVSSSPTAYSDSVSGGGESLLLLVFSISKIIIQRKMISRLTRRFITSRSFEQSRVIPDRHFLLRYFYVSDMAEKRSNIHLR